MMYYPFQKPELLKASKASNTAPDVRIDLNRQEVVLQQPVEMLPETLALMGFKIHMAAAPEQRNTPNTSNY